MMMNDSKDTSLNGTLVGIATPIAAFILLNLLNQVFVSLNDSNIQGFRTQFLAIVSILFNIIPIQIFTRQQRHLALRGTMYATMAVAFFVIGYYWDSLLGG